MRAVVRFAILDPARIFNLCSPRYLPEISLNWKGRHGWHDRRYEPVRDLMERRYIEGFNQAGGHYRHLEESIGRDGVRNPIMISSGRLERRQEKELPPGAPGLVCEYLGGSRLDVAKHCSILVPCIVNDYCGALPEAEVLSDTDAVLAKFRDKPRQIAMNENGGVELNDLPYVHLPQERRYSLAEQSRIRRKIIDGIRADVAQWLRAHDKAD